MFSRIFSAIFAPILEHKWKILIAAAVVITLRCVWLWQPERQVLLHQQHFLEAAQDRDWQKFYVMFDDSFHTSTGKDKVWALQVCRQVLSQFIVLEIHPADTSVTFEGGTARVITHLRIAGNGMGIAEMAKDAVNESPAPFEFTWKHASWKPWDWRLVGADHPLVHQTAGEME